MLIRFPDLKQNKNIPWSRVHVSRLVKRGLFPMPVRLGANTVAWREADIDQWIADRPNVYPVQSTTYGK